jgi:hypothetical protein
MNERMSEVSRWKVLFSLVADIGIDASGLKGSEGKNTTRGPVEESGDGVAGEKDVGGSIKEKKKRNFWRRLRELFRKRA